MRKLESNEKIGTIAPERNLTIYIPTLLNVVVLLKIRETEVNIKVNPAMKIQAMKNTRIEENTSDNVFG